MGIDNFETEACKQILLNPKSLKEVQCKRLKLNINPTEDLKYFKCPSFSRCNLCSNFSTSRCQCERLMSTEIQLSEIKVVDNIQNDFNGVFVRGRSSFVITDDLKVAVRSTDLVLKMLKSLGCGDVSKLGERLVDVGFDEVLTLLECIFSSNTPLTDAFLNKQSPQGSSNINESLIPFMEKVGDEAEPEKVITFSAIVRKHDLKVLYVECREDFVDLLFTFLAVPLGFVLETSGKNSTFGCIGNLFKSSKDLSDTEVLASESVLPHYYRCQKQLLSITTDRPPLYYRYRAYTGSVVVDLLTLNCNQSSFPHNNKAVPVVLIDPKSHGRDQSTEGSGFVKRGLKFTVSDDLIITPTNSCSTFCLLKKLQIQAEDLEVQEISITKTEATILLRASLVTSSAFNSALLNLIKKTPKEETLKNPKEET